jgi:hypothetical protein
VMGSGQGCWHLVYPGEKHFRGGHVKDRWRRGCNSQSIRFSEGKRGRLETAGRMELRVRKRQKSWGHY